jgi:hypothetical protein
MSYRYRHVESRRVSEPNHPLIHALKTNRIYAHDVKVTVSGVPLHARENGMGDDRIV